MGTYHTDVPLDEVLAMCHTRVGHAIIPLAALKMTLHVGAGPEPETWICIVKDAEGRTLVQDVLNREQFAANVEPLVNKNEWLVNLQGVLLAAETEKFLKEPI